MAEMSRTNLYELYRLDVAGNLILDRGGQPVTVFVDRSVLGASKAAPAGTLALQHMAGFDDQCAIVPFHKVKSPVASLSIMEVTPSLSTNTVAATILAATPVSATSRNSEWSENCTLLLISTYADFEVKFKDSRIKQKDVWREVAGVMVNQGYSFNGEECAKKWANLQLRYKKILDNMGENKSGRGTKTWQFFDSIDSICGGRASSVSLRAARSLVQHRKAVPIAAASSLTAVTTPIHPHTVTDIALPAGVISSISVRSLVRPSSDTDEDDVGESGSIKSRSDRVVKRKSRRTDTAPEWFVEAELRMQKSQEKAQHEWQDEFRKQMDRHEKQQVERTAVLKQTNELLKQLIQASQSEH